MATLIGQQVFSLASTTLKMAAAALTVHDSRTASTPLPKWPSVLPQYTLAEVSWHYQPHDCWMVIYDKVYDVSTFLLEHPGGDEVLAEYAGRDATLAFSGVGHSAKAVQMMDKFLVGILVEHERLYLGSADRS